MPKYSADLGNWDKGITVEFEALDEGHAVIHACKLLEEKVSKGELTASADVVQVGKINKDNKTRRIFWDPLNGFND